MIIQYRIRNKENGLEFIKSGEDLGDNQPEWGVDPEIVREDLTPVEIKPSKEEILAAKWAALRKERDAALVASDWCMLGDAPLNREQKAIVANYREALRHLPEYSHDPDQLEVPEFPKL